MDGGRMHHRAREGGEAISMECAQMQAFENEYDKTISPVSG